MFRIIKGLFGSVFDKFHAIIDPNGFVRSIGVKLGSRVTFYGVSRGMFGSEPWLISIGDDCHITAGVKFINHDGGTLILRSEIPTLEWTAPIEIGNRVYIGVNSIILPNVKIGDRCVIGAGSIVSKSIESNSVYAGVPARKICSTDEYLRKLQAKSLQCGNLKGDEKAKVIRAFYKAKGMDL